LQTTIVYESTRFRRILHVYIQGRVDARNSEAIHGEHEAAEGDTTELIQVEEA
jgi:hypothetical protein